MKSVKCFLPLGNELLYILPFKLISLTSYQEVSLFPFLFSFLTQIRALQESSEIFLFLSFFFIPEDVSLSVSSSGDFSKSWELNLSDCEKGENIGVEGENRG